jgi:hypothetical protein
MGREIVRTDEEIDQLLNECCDQINTGGSKFSGMTYEQGLDAAIRWLTGDADEYPLE